MESINRPALSQYQDTNKDTPQFKLSTGMGPITDRIINELMNGFTIDDYRDKINDKFVDPMTKIINQRLRPYMYISGGLYIIIIVLLLIIIYILIIRKK